jgi:hypothetical protein
MTWLYNLTKEAGAPALDWSKTVDEYRLSWTTEEQLAAGE